MARYGLLIDVARCTGCFACVVACKSENSTRPGISWIRIDVTEKGEFPDVTRDYMPILCMQCHSAPCANVCPNGAFSLGKYGIVEIDPGKCDCGNEYPCVDACPFAALHVNSGNGYYFVDYLTPYEKEQYEAHRLGTVEKCNLCSHRIDSGMLPACVQACPSRAIIFGDLDDPGSELSRRIYSRRAKPLKQAEKLDVSVRYVNLRESG